MFLLFNSANFEQISSLIIELILEYATLVVFEKQEKECKIKLIPIIWNFSWNFLDIFLFT